MQESMQQYVQSSIAAALAGSNSSDALVDQSTLNDAISSLASTVTQQIAPLATTASLSASIQQV